MLNIKQHKKIAYLILTIYYYFGFCYKIKSIAFKI